MADMAEFIARLGPDDGELVSERRGAVQWVIFNRPQKLNAMTPPMTQRLLDICGEVNDDRSVRVMVVTGAGGAFISGADISHMRSPEPGEAPRPAPMRGGNYIWNTLEQVRVPTIAAIGGAATGGGAGVASCCDLRIASPKARFGYPIARTLGNSLSIENYARLAALLGIARSKELFLTARLMNAQEMLACGLVIEVVPDQESLFPRTEELAQRITELAPLTLQVSKEALRRVRDRLVPEGDDELFQICAQSNDFKEGRAAFLEKRKPVWTGT